MKNECKEFLEEYISRHCKGNGEEYDFYTLFKHFSAFEISKKEDIIPAVDDFFAFLERCDEAICKSGIHNPPKLVKYSAQVMKRFFSIPIGMKQKAFADVVKTVAPKKENTLILEVGAGMYPRGALYLAETNDNIFAIDSQFVLSGISMKAMNVTAYQKYFDINTQIKDYDLIVGRNPCSAIESIVQSCVRENKPYIIEVCDCGLPKSARQATSHLGWEKILKEHDPKIQFGENGLVFNIDANKRQLQRTIAMRSAVRPKNTRIIKEIKSLPFDSETALI